MGCKYNFLDNPITNMIKKEVEAGDATKPHCFQDSYFHKKVVMMKQKSFMKVVGTSMVSESWNVNLVGEPLALNFVVSMDNRLTMEPRQKGCTEAVMMIQVIRSPPSPPPPLKLSDLSLYEVVSGFTIDPPWRDTKEVHLVRVNDLVLKDEKDEGEFLEFYEVFPIFT